MKRRFRHVPLTLVWIVIGLLFIVPIVQSSNAATKARRAAAIAQAEQARQQQTIDKLTALVKIECVRSTNGALLREKLIDASTQPIATPLPGSDPGLFITVARRNKQLAASAKSMREIGSKIPNVRC